MSTLLPTLCGCKVGVESIGKMLNNNFISEYSLMDFAESPTTRELAHIEQRLSEIVNALSAGDDSVNNSTSRVVSQLEDIKPRLATLLNALRNNGCESLEAREEELNLRWDAARRARAAVTAIQSQLASTDESDKCETPSVASTPDTPAKPSTASNIMETPSHVNAFSLSIGVGGLVGANEFEDPDPSSILAFEDGDSDADSDLPPDFLLSNEPEADCPEPPSPTLESLGLSSLSLGLLKGVLPQADNIHSQNTTPIPHRITSSLRYSNADSDLSKSSSPGAPEITETPSHLHHSMADMNSIFGDLVRAARLDEFNTLPQYISAQISFNMLNEAISEINEFITDKRFHGMDEEETRVGDSDSFTIEELVHVGSIDSSKIKAVIVALLQLSRITSADDGLGGKRYILGRLQ